MNRSALLYLIAVLPLAGCSTTASHQSAMQRSLTGDDGPAITSQELRLRVYEAGALVVGEIEIGADAILARTEDPTIRRNAYLWKISAAPAIQRAAFQSDPLAALTDCWTLVIQMRDFLVDGEGQDLFGQYQPIAVATAENLDAEFARRSLAIVGKDNRDRFESNIREWAEAHPMESLLFVRHSAVEDLAPLIADSEVSGLAAVSSLNEQIVDLSTRLAILGELVPKQARWQTDLLMEDLARGDTGEQLAGRFGQEGRAMLREELDHFLVRAEAMAIADVQLALAFLDEERDRLLVELDDGRDSIAAALTREREAILAAVREERILTLEQAEGIADRIVDRTNTPIHDAIDHLILRLAQLIGVTFLLAALGIWVVRRTGGKRLAADAGG